MTHPSGMAAPGGSFGAASRHDLVAEAERLQRSLSRHVAAGLAGFIVLFGGIGTWAWRTEIAGAVVAPGQLVVESSVKKVQHPTGGVVGEIRVREGDAVEAGDLLLKLDETVTRANLAIVVKGLDESQARLARLAAERDQTSAVTFPAEMTARRADPAVHAILSGEQSLFDLRLQARQGQKAQLVERQRQLGEEIAGLTAQIDAKQDEMALIATELKGVEQLYEQKLISIQRLTQLKRDMTRVRGEHGALVAATAQSRVKLGETELQILQIDQDLRSEVAKEIREVEAHVSELVERKVAAVDQLMRTDLRAPQRGTVHQLAVHTVGGVIGAGESVMTIVPRDDAVTVEVRIAPQDIDQVRPGQAAVLRMSAFSQRTTPEVHGEVLRVSPDAALDAKTGASFYVARVGLDAATLPDLRLIPGMPVEAFVQTGQRTVLSYLTKPLVDQIARAFTER